ncbi:MAG: tetratricopeptide repeat protein, partial [Pseudomonadota bacterium]
QTLAENTDHFDEQQRQRLLLGLAGAAQQTGAWHLFKPWARELVEKQPENLALRVALFEQAMRDADRDAMEEQLDAIRRIEGEGAQWLYGQAVLLSLAAKDQDDPRLDEALGLLERARAERPNWSRVPLLAAGIYERQGRQEQALDSYRAAVDMGDGNPNAYRRLIQLLTQRGLFEEAQQRMQQFDQLGVEFSSDLERLRGGLLVNAGQLDEALEHARQAVDDSDDYADHLWLGRLAAGKGQRERSRGNEEAASRFLHEAEESFLRAAALAPDAPDAHLSIMQLYAATERPELARAQIEQVRKHVDAEHRPLVLASAYELLGETDQAEQQYLAAVEAQPDNALRARALAEFYWRTNRAPEAEKLARRIVEGDGIEASEQERRWARRLLARILMARGGFQNRVAATALIEENLKLGESEADRRMKVTLDQTHPSRRQRQQAIESLEAMVALQDEKAPSDVLELARLYLAADDWAKAKPLLYDLAASHPEELRYAAILVEALLSRSETAEAQPYLDRIVEAAPNSFGTVSLQAEMLFRKEQYEQALELLQEFVDRPDAEPADAAVRMRLVAGALEQLTDRLRQAEQDSWARRFLDAAETLYRRYLEGHPEHELLLAAFLARQGRTVEAVGMFERRWATLNSENLAQLAGILFDSDAATDDHRKRAERIVERAIEERDDTVPLHIVLARRCAEQQRYDEARQHYRSVLQQQPDHAVAMNNLAVLLALQGVELDEAEQLVERAVELAGPVAAMLDSRATVYTALGEYDKALSDLEVAIAENPSPVWLFHRALVYDRMGRKQAAAESLAEAHERGLTADMLQPLERPDYERMRQSLSP